MSEQAAGHFGVPIKVGTRVSRIGNSKLNGRKGTVLSIDDNVGPDQRARVSWDWNHAGTRVTKVRANELKVIGYQEPAPQPEDDWQPGCSKCTREACPVHGCSNV